MPTFWSQTLIPTLRQAPADAEVPSHRLMLRAGLIRKLGSGSYTYLPLGLRAIQRVQQIIREEMAAAGAEEIFMPTLIPLDLFKQTGRDEAYGDNLFRIEDRHGRLVALGPTHEEVITELFGAYVESYKDLPKTLYQIQTKFRDEFRPRFGVLRSREFTMKDAYSFHLTVDGPGGLDETYQKQYDAYERIFTRCGLPYMTVEAEAGPIGGSASHEFMVPSPTGEDTILTNDNGYAANVEKCEIGPRKFDLEAEPTGELEQVHTPGCPGIEDVCNFFKKNLGSKLAKKNMLKTLVCGEPDHWTLAVVRGDHDLNEGKLDVPLANEGEAKQAGFAIGFSGPHVAVGRKDVKKVVVDHDAAQGGFWVSGANKVDYHVKHFNWKREVLDAGIEVEVRDIRNAVDGDPAPEERGGGTLRAQKGIEVGHVFKLGSKYTDAMGVTVTDPRNEQAPVLMGCYGIGVNRILAAAIECDNGHDDGGIIWPRAIAPFDVLITTIKYEPGNAVAQAACGFAEQLEARGYTVLIDDRDDRPGPKFKDADLIGIPLRITVGEKGLGQSPPAVDLKARNGSNGPKGETVPVEQAVSRAAELLAGL
ncbi:MAG: proline--tRNA ligase [Planctomycetes bacterium]|jgi:prolyl-tRNA synthetase|nr:proline--tRNA ligase [Planctomycetota bacterium]